MILQGLSITNFLGFRDEVTLRFDATHGLTLIEGENGAGKTSIIEAVLWCFYGKTLRGYKGDQVMHRFAKQNCVVKQSFLDDAGKPCKVIRARKSKAYGTGVRLYCSGKDVTPRRADEQQAAIDKAVGMTYEAFTSAVIFKAGDAFSFCQLRPAEKAAVLDQVLGLTTYAKAEQLARKRAASLETDLREAEQAARIAQQREDDARAEIARLQKVQAEQDASTSIARKRLQKELASCETATKELGAKLQRTRVQLAREEKRSDKLYAVLKKKKGASRKLESALAATKAECKAASAVYDAYLAGQCPTCTSVLRDSTRLQETRQRCRDLCEQQVAQEAALRRADKKQTKLDAAHQKALRELQKLRNRESNERAALRVLSQQSDALRSKLRDLKLSGQHTENILEDANKRAALHALVVKSHSTAARKYKRQVKQAAFWVEGFGARGGIRSRVVAGAVPFLNQMAAEASQALTGGAVQVRFETTRKLKSGDESDVINVSVINEDGAVDYAGCSDGEKARVNLCAGAALSAYALRSSKANVVFFDEPFDHMSAQNVDRSLAYLLEASKHASVYVITHNGELKHAATGVHRVWTVTKTNRHATVQES